MSRRCPPVVCGYAVKNILPLDPSKILCIYPTHKRQYLWLAFPCRERALGGNSVVYQVPLQRWSPSSPSSSFWDPHPFCFCYSKSLWFLKVMLLEFLKFTCGFVVDANESSLWYRGAKGKQMQSSPYDADPWEKGELSVPFSVGDLVLPVPPWDMLKRTDKLVAALSQDLPFPEWEAWSQTPKSCLWAVVASWGSVCCTWKPHLCSPARSLQLCSSKWGTFFPP